MHASAACRDGYAIACIGESGAGKSTAAAQLCANHGFALLADDVVGLERQGLDWLALGTESSHWLLGESAAFKVAVPAPRARTIPTRLSAIVRLRAVPDAHAPRVVRLTGIAAYAALSQALLRFERSPEHCKRDIDVLAELLSRARVYDLSRPAALTMEETATMLTKIVMERRP